MYLHATCVAIAVQGILLVGPSGSGKSQLAHRLIQRGAWLIADDQTILTVTATQLIASCPPPLNGKLEVRGLGIVAAPHQTLAPARLILDLDPTNRPAQADYRLPDPKPWPLAPKACRR